MRLCSRSKVKAKISGMQAVGFGEHFLQEGGIGVSKFALLQLGISSPISPLSYLCAVNTRTQQSVCTPVCLANRGPSGH